MKRWKKETQKKFNNFLEKYEREKENYNKKTKKQKHLMLSITCLTSNIVYIIISQYCSLIKCLFVKKKEIILFTLKIYTAYFMLHLNIFIIIVRHSTCLFYMGLLRQFFVVAYIAMWIGNVLWEHLTEFKWKKKTNYSNFHWAIAQTKTKIKWK